MNDKDMNLEGLSKQDIGEAKLLVSTIAEMQRSTAAKLCISEKKLIEILNEERKVARVVLENERPHGQIAKHMKRLGIAAMLIMLLCCFVIDGFADSVRGSLLYIFIGPRATRVEVMEYDKSANLSGLVVPSEMLEGYTYHTHVQPRGSDMFNVVYADADGKTVLYYYYPHSTTASYDNENARSYSVNFDGGTMTVWRTDDGQTATCFPYMGGAFIQMEFEADVSDDELRAIAGSLKRQ